ncbi:hypothetical protein GSI_12706 [Ganoderma sinense ZZ0214-1]|uniref:Uncharacterized protein n=1 Tax=Ganoderma sinense ZZ0214-1 TaxID=1077348 RepID=A0A2G8RTJ4_9APHY|nr:hypothetical protein GSI_12706 [Ganoderma sinense ZZ0214-1]
MNEPMMNSSFTPGYGDCTHSRVGPDIPIVGLSSDRTLLAFESNFTTAFTGVMFDSRHLDPSVKQAILGSGSILMELSETMGFGFPASTPSGPGPHARASHRQGTADCAWIASWTLPGKAAKARTPPTEPTGLWATTTTCLSSTAYSPLSPHPRVPHPDDPHAPVLQGAPRRTRSRTSTRSATCCWSAKTPRAGSRRSGSASGPSRPTSHIRRVPPALGGRAEARVHQGPGLDRASPPPSLSHVIVFASRHADRGTWRQFWNFKMEDQPGQSWVRQRDYLDAVRRGYMTKDPSQLNDPNVWVPYAYRGEAATSCRVPVSLFLCYYRGRLPLVAQQYLLG